MIRSWLDKNARGLTISLAMAVVFFYFLYMTVQGDRGIIAMLRLQNEIRDAEKNLAQIKTERAALEARVTRMRPGGIDPDLLDEQARRQLNIAKPNEVILLDAPQQTHNKNQSILQRSK